MTPTYSVGGSSPAFSGTGQTADLLRKHRLKQQQKVRESGTVSTANWRFDGRRFGDVMAGRSPIVPAQRSQGDD